MEKPYRNVALHSRLGLVCEALATLSSGGVASAGIRDGAVG